MYSDGLATGSMCKPLCEKAELSYHGCLSHRSKFYVMMAKWNGTAVVLKANASARRPPPALASHDGKRRAKDSMNQLKAIVEQEFLGQESTDVMEFLLSQCDVGRDNVFSRQEWQNCWNLGSGREFVLLAALQDSIAMPRLLGVCGNMYAVEYAPSDAFTSPALLLREVRGWNFRAKLAIALIGMVESLARTKYGMLYLCDVMESNFGIVRDRGKYKIRAIDNGESYLNQTIPIALKDFRYTLRDCTDHSDCDHLGCNLHCDVSSRKCVPRVTSNNLQVSVRCTTSTGGGMRLIKVCIHSPTFQNGDADQHCISSA